MDKRYDDLVSQDQYTWLASNGKP